MTAISSCCIASDKARLTSSGSWTTTPSMPVRRIPSRVSLLSLIRKKRTAGASFRLICGRYLGFIRICCGSVPVRHPIQTSCWTGPGNATGRTRTALVFGCGKDLPSRAVQYPPDRPLAGTYAGGTPGPATRHSSPARMARETPSARPELRCFTDTGRVWPTSSGRGSRSAGRRGQSLRPGPRR